MDNDGNGFVYADQETAEKAASGYRSILVDLTEMLAELAIETDSLKLHRMADRLKESQRDINF